MKPCLVLRRHPWRCRREWDASYCSFVLFYYIRGPSGLALKKKREDEGKEGILMVFLISFNAQK